MSLTSAVKTPGSPIRRFLDAEITVGSKPMRGTYRARLPSRPPLLLHEDVRLEAGAVGTAVDARLRLAFTVSVPVPAPVVLVVDECASHARRARGRVAQTWAAVTTTGKRLCLELREAVARLQPSDRSRPLCGAEDEEEHLARMLLAAAWYEVLIRAPIAFIDTPLWNNASPKLDLPGLLGTVDERLVADVCAQGRLADTALEPLRNATPAERCRAGPTFVGSRDVTADADLIVDGMLIDVKSTRRVYDFPLTTINQLLGYVLLDYHDEYQIDAVGVYLSRLGARGGS